jgi:hypothetical protein
MAAGAWIFYNKGRKNLCNGGINLGTGTFRMALFTSASNAGTVTLSTYGSLTPEVTNANGYTTLGVTLTGVTWTAGASAKQMRFNCSAKFWSANAGSIASIKFAVIYTSGASAGAKKLVCASQLSTAQFTITSGNRLTITPAATGIFNLAG